ncbi:MAG: hypothetical protein ACR2FN_11860 [Chitinophagaceae bacterium]
MNNEYEAIRIVPLLIQKSSPSTTHVKKGSGDENLFHVPSTAQVPKPHLIYNGGTLIQNVDVFTVFWGANWNNTASYKILAQDINKFFSVILTSSLIDQLSEYNSSTHSIGHGTLNGTKTITANAPASGTSIKDSAIQTALKNWISSHSVASVTANRLYFIYTDINVKVILGGSSSCTNFCGYHNNVGSTYYAVMPFPSCAGCLGGLSALDVITATSSHELCEAITDPIPGTGWYDQMHGEIGDICAWKFKKVKGYNVQREWSNKANTCI